MAGYKKGTVGYELQQMKYRATMSAKFGSEEEKIKYYQAIGTKGGRNGHTGGFAANPALASLAGRKGGTISSRSESKKPLEERRKQYEESL